MTFFQGSCQTSSLPILFFPNILHISSDNGYFPKHQLRSTSSSKNNILVRKSPSVNNMLEAFIMFLKLMKSTFNEVKMNVVQLFHIICLG
ncbi:hypothetical protein AQUCO_04900070v1 [Aquilegia coerulea]|uniref:Uncharacterized protein n=1 Tax=Aquilegia coerulea TaxID=218851 RepID=A0A2G5CJN3_AQUCA|nr:hypothetical protein AQUCO_04900070v1 [Aquilegia coerulea]